MVILQQRLAVADSRMVQAAGINTAGTLVLSLLGPSHPAAAVSTATGSIPGIRPNHGRLLPDRAVKPRSCPSRCQHTSRTQRQAPVPEETSIRAVGRPTVTAFGGLVVVASEACEGHIFVYRNQLISSLRVLQANTDRSRKSAQCYFVPRAANNNTKPSQKPVFWCGWAYDGVL